MRYERRGGGAYLAAPICGMRAVDDESAVGRGLETLVVVPVDGLGG